MLGMSVSSFTVRSWMGYHVLEYVTLESVTSGSFSMSKIGWLKRFFPSSRISGELSNSIHFHFVAQRFRPVATHAQCRFVHVVDFLGPFVASGPAGLVARFLGGSGLILVRNAIRKPKGCTLRLTKGKKQRRQATSLDGNLVTYSCSDKTRFPGGFCSDGEQVPHRAPVKLKSIQYLRSEAYLEREDSEFNLPGFIFVDDTAPDSFPWTYICE